MTPQRPKFDPNDWRRLCRRQLTTSRSTSASPTYTPEQESEAVRRGAPRGGASKAERLAPARPASAHDATLNACSPPNTPEQESAAVRRGAPRSGAGECAPGGTRTRAFPVEGRASSPARPRGRAREAVGGSGIEPGPARYQRAVPRRTPASDGSSGGRARTCVSRSTVARLPCSTTPERTEGEGVEPPRP